MKELVKKIFSPRGSFLHQLTVSFTVGIVTLILIASIVTSWFASRRTEGSLIKHGHQISENLARQSTLALLYSEGENAKAAAQGALAFPDVLSVSIYNTALELLLHEGEEQEEVIISSLSSIHSSTLVADKESYWRFRAPVFSPSEVENEFVIPNENSEPELLGYADVILSKKTLVDNTASIFIANSIIFSSLAIVLLLVLRFMARKITRPLNTLSDVMYKAESGIDNNTYAEEAGPKEARVIAHAFNKMIKTINERDRSLRNQNLTLEKRVQERTVELAEARDKAIEASKTKSSFLANMSHELRTPLNAIIGYSELIMEDAIEQDNKELYGDLHKIKSSGVHLLSLINDVLDLSKIEAGKMDLYIDVFTVKSMIADVQSVVEPLAKKNNNTLHVICPDNITTMTSDETKIRQSLLNLLSNACKFTKNGEVSLVVSPHMINGKEGISFCVADQGIGMTQAQIGNLFKEFTQADSSTTREYGGTGLGLTISKRFCNMMGGDICVNSIVGEGSVFTIYLPLTVSDISIVEPGDKVRKTEERRTRSSKVIILDDNSDRELHLTKMLKNKGFDVSKGEPSEKEHNWDQNTIVVNILSKNLYPFSDHLSEICISQAHPFVLTAQHEESGPGVALRSIIAKKSQLSDTDYWAVLRNYLENSEYNDVVVITNHKTWFNKLEEIIRQEGIRLIHAFNDDDAVTVLNRTSPSLIILDTERSQCIESSLFLALSSESVRQNSLVVWVADSPHFIDTAKTMKDLIYKNVTNLPKTASPFSASLTDLVAKDMRLR